MKRRPRHADRLPADGSGAAGTEPALAKQSLAKQSLAELIRAGDRAALAGFLDAREPKIRTFCAEACPAELLEEACDAAKVDFVGRLRVAGDRDVNDLDLDQLLLNATRSAAAGRFRVEEPIDEHWQRKRTVSLTDEATCQAMPELVAAEANGELRPGGPPLAAHVRGCPTCQDTVARMERAEAAFARALSGSREVTHDTVLEALDAVREERPTRHG